MPISPDEFRRKAIEQGIPAYVVEQYLQERQKQSFGLQSSQQDIAEQALDIKTKEAKLTELQEGDPEEKLAQDARSGQFSVSQLFQKYGTEIDPDTILQIYNQQQNVPGGYGAATESPEWLAQQGVKGTFAPAETGIGQKKKNESAKIGGLIQTMLSEYENIPKKQKGAFKGSVTKRLGFIYPQASQYEKGLAGFAGAIKQLVGEAGMLTNYDIQRIVNVFPRTTDTPEQAEIAKKRINEIFIRSYGMKLFEDVKDERSTDINKRVKEIIGGH